MRRLMTLILVAAVAVLVASQLLLPRYLEGRIEDRLTVDGGAAEVSLEALPALRLVAGYGDRIEVRASGISIDLATRPASLDQLDGFDTVDVRLTDVAARPFRAEAIALTRPTTDSPYKLAVTASVSPRELSSFAGAELGGALGGLFGGLAGSVSPLADEPIPVDLEVQVRREGERFRITGGAGTIAGFPAGPVAEALAAAIVSRL